MRIFNFICIVLYQITIRSTTMLFHLGQMYINLFLTRKYSSTRKVYIELNQEILLVFLNKGRER